MPVPPVGVAHHVICGLHLCFLSKVLDNLLCTCLMLKPLSWNRLAYSN